MHSPVMSNAIARFVASLERALATPLAEAELLPQVGSAMRRLVASDDWLDAAYAQPHPEFYQQYLLYADPQARFSLVSFVWGAGQTTPIHDHTVWGCIGMLRGAEIEQAYRLDAHGQPQPHGEAVALQPGDIGFVSPAIGDIHKVSNALNEAVSISIHAYGADIGTVSRHVFPAGGGAPKPFISGYTEPRL